MVRTATIALACAALAACATPYQESGLLGGVSAQRIDETTVQITAQGNAFTDQATIARYMIRKAAETTLAAGYDTFAFIDVQDATKVRTLTTPGQANTTTTANVNGTVNSFGIDSATYNARGTANSRTTYTPPQTETFVSPGGVAVVKMYRGAKPENAPGNVYSAAEVVRYMTPPAK